MNTTMTMEEMNAECQRRYQVSVSIGLPFWIYPYEDHHLLRIDNSVRKATEQEVALWDALEWSRAAQAGAEWSKIAASAYHAYAASTENKNFRGEPMPAFDDLPIAIRTAWEAAVRQAGSVIEGGSYGLDIEQRWAGWTPPQMEQIA